MKKDWLAREMTMEVVVGAFVFMILLGLGYFTIMLSRDAWLRPAHRLEVIFDEVMGLRDGDSVVARGMPVGKVRDLILADDGVHVHCSLDQPLALRQGYKITIVATSILGGRHVSIDAGPDDHAPLPEDAVIRGERPYDLMGDAAQLISDVRKGLVEDGLIHDVQVAAERFRAIMERVEGGEGSLGRLLSADDSVYEDVAAAVASLRTLTARLEAGEGVLGQLLSADNELSSDLAATLRALRATAERLESGEGAIGRLLNDDELYEEIRAAVIEFRATIDDLRETAPITTFTSVFFGAF